MHVIVDVPPGGQLRFSFSGVGEVSIGATQLMLPGIIPTTALGPEADSRSAEVRIREFERERFRVRPYILETASGSYPKKKIV
jgi:hypothetical protein